MSKWYASSISFSVANICVCKIFIRELKQQDRSEVYKLTSGKLFRLYLVKQHDSLFTLIFSCHHIIVDGWSLPLLHDDVHHMYLDLFRGYQVAVSEDHAYEATQLYWQEHRSDNVSYWLEQLEKIVERSNLSGLVRESLRYKTTLKYEHRLIHCLCFTKYSPIVSTTKLNNTAQK
jgi:N-(5-amino-5-carboxypentanoyl)-L-cysteinyl-D-valine synthase